MGEGRSGDGGTGHDRRDHHRRATSGRRHARPRGRVALDDRRARTPTTATATMVPSRTHTPLDPFDPLADVPSPSDAVSVPSPVVVGPVPDVEVDGSGDGVTAIAMGDPSQPCGTVRPIAVVAAGDSGSMCARAMVGRLATTSVASAATTTDQRRRLGAANDRRITTRGSRGASAARSRRRSRRAARSRFRRRR